MGLFLRRVAIGEPMKRAGVVSLILLATLSSGIGGGSAMDTAKGIKAL